MTPLAYIVSLPVRAYRLVFSPWVGFNCRYQPTCSAYAMEALEKHGAIKGSYLAAKRIGRCHPLGGMGLRPCSRQGQRGRRDQKRGQRQRMMRPLHPPVASRPPCPTLP